ncbi:MAG: cell wall-binding repeat-containing protein [Intrasporangium sp.]|nr:cell wall-binding repeat-containing protein [Intrasporangium sp.]MDN5797950.1 cell wall-binding repeat-containing protein [Intrasporangium sp.]
MSGEDFPDASVAAAIPALDDLRSGSTMLLVKKQGIPPVVEAELRRLHPEEISIVGGPGAVSEGVATSLRTVTGVAQISRFAGADRYETSVKVATPLFLWMEGYEPGRVFIASGEDFADAVTAAQLNPLQNSSGVAAPVLLTRRDSLPPSVRDYLRDQPPWMEDQEVVVVGGPGAVSERVAAEIRTLRPEAKFTRLGGKDRYETAAKVARSRAEQPAHVYLATGRDFPDALVAASAVSGDVAASVASGTASRILLTLKDCHPLSTAAALTAFPLAARTVVGQADVAYLGTRACP